jgi:hypothetical protein
MARRSIRRDLSLLSQGEEIRRRIRSRRRCIYVRAGRPLLGFIVETPKSHSTYISRPLIYYDKGRDR